MDLSFLKRCVHLYLPTSSKLSMQCLHIGKRRCEQDFLCVGLVHISSSLSGLPDVQVFVQGLLEIMNTDPTKDRFKFQRLVFIAKGHLHTIEANPPPDCGPDSPAQLSFDPYIGRRLQMATPIRVIPPPSFGDTCKAVNNFLDGLYEVGVLETVDNLATWQVRPIF